MLSVFGDESADGTKQRVFAVAGVIGSEDLWENLETKWVARTGGIPFHAKDCDSDRGHYSKTDHADNKALYQDLVIMLAESGLGGSGFAIDLVAQRRVFPDAPDIAYYKCFLEVVQAMKNCAVSNNQTVRFTFDRRRESEYNTGVLYDIAAKNPKWKRHIFGSIALECSREHPRLQVADLLAREVMKALDNRIGPVKRPPRRFWLTLYNTGRFHADAISHEWFGSLKRQMPMLEQAAGMSPEGYSRWLADNKLQDNTSNKFLYIRWLEEKEER
jgi:hypothetical protein